MKVLITGAFGLIGREVVTQLQDRHELTLMDRVRPEEATIYVGAASPTRRTAAPVTFDLPFIQADIGDVEAIRSAAAGQDALIHLAGNLVGDPAQGVDIFRDNALGTFIVLDAARLGSVKRVLCASSINAFGTFYWRLSGQPVEYDGLPLDEDFPPVPEDPYSLSKVVAEETCAAFSRAYGLTTAAFRFAVVYSSERYHRTLDAGLPKTEEWSADLYQWVHVRDVAQGIRQALEAPKLPRFGIYTLSAADTRCPEPTMQILERFQPSLARHLKISLTGRAPLLSIERARSTFGYAPAYRLGV